MDYKTLIGLTSALVGGSVVGGQDPSFEYPAVQPKSNAETILTRSTIPVEREIATVAPLPDLGRIVVTASNVAPLCEELTIGLPQDPQREKELKELHERMMKEFGPDSEFMKKLHQELGDAKKWEQHAKELQGKAGQHKMSEQDAKKWEQFHKEMEKRFGEGSEFQKKMKVWNEQHSKEMEKRFGPGSEFEKKMKIWSEQDAKEMEKRFGPGSEFEKKMRVWSDQHSKQIEKEFGPGSDFAKKMKAYKLENGKMRELTPQEQKELEKKMSELRIKLKDLPMPPKMDFKFREIPMPETHFKFQEVPFPKMPAMPKMPEGSFRFQTVPLTPAVPAVPGKLAPPAAPRARFHSTDLVDIAKSLTPSQREKNKAQGFLYWSDLNKDQQGKLGAQGWSGNWTITYTKDSETFTVKSDPK